MDKRKRRLVVGMSGASGVILGIRLLEYLRQKRDRDASGAFTCRAADDRQGNRLAGERCNRAGDPQL